MQWEHCRHVRRVGLESGIEAAIHAVRKSFEEDNSECLLIVDADNAFNKLNRNVSLENIKRLCPPMYTYLHNSYNTPATLYLENRDHSDILSQEGVTQGDNAAMAMYALSTQPLIQPLSKETANDEVKQVWYAEDSSAVGSLAGLKKWWEYLQANGPDFGYCPKPAKTILLIKDSSQMQAAQKIFKGDGIKITDQGECLLGSVIGTESFREQYIKNKVESWVKDVQSLTKHAQDDPQAAYSAFTKGVSSRWTHFQKTVPDASELFEPLENVIRDQLIPALVDEKLVMPKINTCSSSQAWWARSDRPSGNCQNGI